MSTIHWTRTFGLTLVTLLVATLGALQAQAPFVISVERHGDAAGYVEDERDFLVRFNEQVNGVGAADFATTGSICVTSVSMVGNRALALGAPNSRAVMTGITGFPSTEITVEGWFRTSQISGALFSYSTSSNVDTFRLGNPSQLTLRINDIHELVSSADISDGNWHHVAATWNASNGNARIIVDGTVEAQSAIATGESLAAGGDFVVGQDKNSFAGSFGSNFVGDVDEIRVWSVSRTLLELNSNDGRRLNGDNADLELYLPMDEIRDMAVGDAATGDCRDLSSNANHADTTATVAIQSDADQLDGTTRRVRVDFLFPNPGVLLGLDVLDDGTITDTTNNNLVGPFSGGENYVFTPTAIAPLTFLVPSPGYPTIASAILESCSGDTIEIAPGTYFESGLDLQGKSLIIRGLGDDPSETVIDCQNNGRGLLIDGDGPTEVTIENLTFHDGRAPDGSGDLRHGGNVLVNNAVAIFRRCVFDLGRSGNGVNAAGGQGGGMTVQGSGSDVEIIECLFTDNRAGTGEIGFPGGNGGGLAVRTGATALVQRSRFIGNAGGNGGGPASANGGNGGAVSLATTSSSLTLINCVMYDNRGGDSTGLASQSNVGRGAVFLNSNATCTIHFCTIVQNDNGIPEGETQPDNDFGGSGISGSSSATIRNTIARGPGDNPVENVGIHNLIHSNVKGLGANGTNCIDTAALFVSAATGDLRLSGASPCIDAGNTSQITDIDIEGRVRIYGFQADMGAHEYYEFPGTGEDFSLTLTDFGDETGINVGELIRLRMESPNQTFVNSPLTLAAQLQFSQVPAPQSFPGAWLSFASPNPILLLVGSDSPFGPSVIGPTPTDYFLQIPDVASGFAVLWQAFVLDGSIAANGIFASSDGVYTYVR